MKFKLSKRLNNVLIHTHTVSGIVISVVLFIVFFCGAISLFKDEFYAWENQRARVPMPASVDLDGAFSALAQAKPMLDTAAQMTFVMPHESAHVLKIFAAEFTDSTRTESERFALYMQAEAPFDLITSTRDQTTIGESLYRLHYLGQVPLGLRITGVISLFFLFATITGVVIHLRKMVERFYAIRWRGKPRVVWKNIHTVLGLIGVPFQVVFGVTGALFGLMTFILAPTAFILYGGDTDQVLATVNPAAKIQVDPGAAQSKELPSINACYSVAVQQDGWGEVVSIQLRNYNRVDALATVAFDDRYTINGTGVQMTRMHSQDRVFSTHPNDKAYADSVLNSVTKLHFGSFGGLALKVLYFLLSMLTCFMLISGILLWYEARATKAYTPKQRRFHFAVTKWYLAICMALYPAVALMFVLNKCIPLNTPNRSAWMNLVLFGGWLVLVGLAWSWKSFKAVNGRYLRMGGVLGVLVPVVNGLATGDWLWNTWSSGQWQVFAVDLVWLVVGVFTIWVACFPLRKPDNAQPMAAQAN